MNILSSMNKNHINAANDFYAVADFDVSRIQSRSGTKNMQEVDFFGDRTC